MSMMGMFTGLNISASGLRAQRLRQNVIASNLANAETTRTPEGGPYRRRDVVFSTDQQASPFSAVFQMELAEGVRVADVILDDRAPELRYMPGHPDADANGFVAYPNVDVNTELVDLMIARRVHEANATAFQAAKAMLKRALEI